MALDYHYFNLHNRVWSVMNRGLVIAHVSGRYIENPTFVVRPAGQRKVRETGRKNVHAFVKGKGSSLRQTPGAYGRLPYNRGDYGWREVSYNPYRTVDGEGVAPFYLKATGEPVFKAREAVLTEDRKLFVRF
jgi:hypothetical protein